MTDLILGFAEAISVLNLFYCFLGISIGMMVGVLPGIGPTAAIAILFPFTYYLDNVTSSLIMMTGIYYGSMYGGSITAILLKLPGEISSVIAARDGHAMALRGQAGAALGITAIGSFVGGCIATICIAIFTPMLIKVVLSIQIVDYFSIIFFGLICSCIFSQGTLLKSLIMLLLGIMLGTIGTDIQFGEVRFIFDMWYLASGLPLMTLVMGLFGIAEILHHYFHGDLSKSLKYKKQIKIFSKESITKMKTAWSSIIRGSGIGSFVGVLPGGGAILSSFVAYMVEEKISKTPSKFGNGEIKGLASAESANNAGAQTSIIPLLCLGFPVNSVMALFLSVLLVNNVATGPAFLENNSKLFWVLIASMLIGNLMLVFVNIFAVPVFLSITKIKQKIINFIVIAACTIGVYYINYNFFDVVVMYFFGVIGYFLKRCSFDFTTVLLGFLLGPRLEEYFIQLMRINHGDLLSLLNSKISIFFYILSLIVLFYCRSNKKNA